MTGARKHSSSGAFLALPPQPTSSPSPSLSLPLPPRHQSPTTENPQYHFDSLQDTMTGQPDGASYARRRPSRNNSNTSVPSQSVSPPYAESNSGSDQWAKAPRKTMKKAARRDSGYTESSTSVRPEPREPHHANDAAAFMPKLGQIREGKASKHSKSRGSSIVSSSAGSKTRRRRNIEDKAVDRSREQRKISSSQRYPHGLAALSNNPSLLSIDSGITQQSGASGGSTSTVTGTSYEYYTSHGVESVSPRQNQQATPTEALNPRAPADDTTKPYQADVFQFLRPDSEGPLTVSDDTQHMTPSTTASSFSSSSSSSGDTHLEDDQASTVGTFPHEIESPTSSPMSMRKSDNDEFHYQGRDYRKSRAPLYASSFVHGHAEEEGEEEEEEGDSHSNEDENEEENEEESDDEDRNRNRNRNGSETESEEELDHDAHGEPADAGHAASQALNKVPAPSTTRKSDPHTQRLRQQERNLANHVLQSPQPQRNVQFGVDPSANHQAMPLYSPQAYSAASSTASHATWPPMPAMPPPLPIAYSPHASPERSHAFPLTVRQSGEGIQPMPAPFPAHMSQPPVYPASAPGPDLSRTTIVGYELLAEKLSEPRSTAGKQRTAQKGSKGKIMPMYRKFEHLNHRVLLHLQDEVSEMEEELRYLDEVIAQTSPRDESGRSYPGSRRGDARYGAESHYRRTELLGRIFQKLGQYNQALCSFNSLLKELEPSAGEDVKAYRTWMDKRTPIDYAETRFLAREQDLVVVSRKPPTTTHETASHPHSAAVWFPLTLALPLLAFAIVPGLVGRLVVITLLCGGELWMVRVTPELVDFMSTQEWSVAAIGYFGVMAVLAGVAR